MKTGHNGGKKIGMKGRFLPPVSRPCSTHRKIPRKSGSSRRVERPDCGKERRNDAAISDEVEEAQ